MKSTIAAENLALLDAVSELFSNRDYKSVKTLLLSNANVDNKALVESVYSTKLVCNNQLWIDISLGI